MTELYSKLQFQLTPDLAGLIWITDEKLLDRPNGFNELDYFFDGLLTQFAAQPEVPSFKTTFFSTESFGNDFSLTHLQPGEEKIEKDLENIMGLLHKKDALNRPVAVLNLSSKQLKLKDNRFQILDI
ncbi:hypothetical protein M899_2844 [Bacteriovorax sp. BSW11_IV]|uniref:hypothetical protein n=1 Tax=Bacteriovorax sp. BSW11_IV TaxID=1353529 RepID=UPI000389F686|nr:hypothetical protein [Bacteriovorax sp. BSW11_IV]EQC50154.1 hypothetical protein M899_2844 [Bacteriovorax sp. BSW11_IV]